MAHEVPFSNICIPFKRMLISKFLTRLRLGERIFNKKSRSLNDLARYIGVEKSIGVEMQPMIGNRARCIKYWSGR